MFQKVLVTVDGSRASQKAVEWAVQAHAETPNTQITLLYVHQPFAHSTPYSYAPATFDYREYLVEMPNPSPSQEALQQFVQRAHVKEKTLVGNPADSILNEAKEGGYDCIVLGSEGHGAIATVLLGSVSARILHHAPCSVLIIR